jgi:ABC-type lipoprotein export system ATPase subunit
MMSETAFAAESSNRVCALPNGPKWGFDGGIMVAMAGSGPDGLGKSSFLNLMNRLDAITDFLTSKA